MYTHPKPVIIFHKDTTKPKNTFEMLCEAGTLIKMKLGSMIGDLTPPVNYPFYLTMSDEEFEQHMKDNSQIEWVAL